MRAALAERLACGYLDNDATLADTGGCDAVALAGAGGTVLHDGGPAALPMLRAPPGHSSAASRPVPPTGLTNNGPCARPAC